MIKRLQRVSADSWMRTGLPIITGPGISTTVMCIIIRLHLMMIHMKIQRVKIVMKMTEPVNRSVTSLCQEEELRKADRLRFLQRR